MRMEKLAYYSQAWHLARTGAPLFEEPIEAWVNGPVIRELYNQHRGQFSLSAWSTAETRMHCRLTSGDIVDEVLRTYGERSATWLSELTDDEEPWRCAREGVPDLARSAAIIDPTVMERYYRTQEENEPRASGGHAEPRDPGRTGAGPPRRARRSRLPSPAVAARCRPRCRDTALVRPRPLSTRVMNWYVSPLKCRQVPAIARSITLPPAESR